MMSTEGICTAKVTKWRCMRGVMLKEPAVGFMQAQYCVLVTSFRMILICTCASHLSVRHCGKVIKAFERQPSCQDHVLILGCSYCRLLTKLSCILGEARKDQKISDGSLLYMRMSVINVRQTLSNQPL